uniref:MalT-like TPR region domain-containing protein n=1 Tax=Cafeteria roenbergensis TaxID=33653 RepID=A0A7S0JSU6_CAFRO
MREAGAEQVSPDAVMAGGGDAAGLAKGKLVAAGGALLGADNVARAADAVEERLVTCWRAGQADDVASVRRAVKTGLHCRGLGLRHAWRVLGVILDRAGAPGGVGLPPSVLRAAAACASLPSPGSSGAAALECLVSEGAAGGADADADWLLACCVARGVAARGRGVPMATTVLVGWEAAASGCAVAQAWAAMQRECGRRVKVSGSGAQSERRGAALSFGGDSAGLAERMIASQLRGLRLSERLCGEAWRHHRGGAAHSLSETCARASSDGGLEVLCLLVAAGWSENFDGRKAIETRLRACAFRLLERGDYDAALDLLERSRRIEASSLGNTHPQLAGTLFTMAQCWQGKGDKDKALELAGQSAEIFAESVGVSHPHYGVCLQFMQKCKQ